MLPRATHRKPAGRPRVHWQVVVHFSRSARHCPLHPPPSDCNTWRRQAASLGLFQEAPDRGNPLLAPPDGGRWRVLAPVCHQECRWRSPVHRVPGPRFREPAPLCAALAGGKPARCLKNERLQSGRHRADAGGARLNLVHVRVRGLHLGLCDRPSSCGSAALGTQETRTPPGVRVPTRSRSAARSSASSIACVLARTTCLDVSLDRAVQREVLSASCGHNKLHFSATVLKNRPQPSTRLT